MKIQREINLLQDKLKQSKKIIHLLEKRQSLSQNGLIKITKMQNLTQNVLHQIKKIQNQSLHELIQIAKMRRIKNYKNMSKEKLLIALLKSEQSLAELYNKVEENKVEETKQYPDYVDPNYKGIKDIKNLFDEFNGDYYKPVITKSAYNNYIQYESREERTETKIYHHKNVFHMIRPYLRDMINNHKAPLEGSLDNDLHGEWKIQLTMQINFVSSSDPGEIRTRH